MACNIVNTHLGRHIKQRRVFPLLCTQRSSTILDTYTYSHIVVWPVVSRHVMQATSTLSSSK